MSGLKLSNARPKQEVEIAVSSHCLAGHQIDLFFIKANKDVLYYLGFVLF